jgi:hypothetical protein
MSYFNKIKMYGNGDSGNSSTTPLSSGATFTGTAIDILDYGIIFVNVTTDVASATDGLSLEQSSDGTNWDHTDVYTVPAGSNKNYAINPHAQYFRVRYTNGASNQTEFRLQTILKGNSKSSSHRIQDSISDEDDAELTKAVITGENGSGTFKNVQVTADGNLEITDSSNGLSIAQGKITGTTFVHKFGEAPDFDIADGFVTMWDGADDSSTNAMTYTYSATADIDSLVSSNAGDTQNIEVIGLDTNFSQVTQTVTLNGQTRVALSTSLVRVFRMVNRGSTNLAGNAYCYVNSAITSGVPNDKTKVRAKLRDGNNQTLMATYTVPAGKTAYMRDWYASLSKKKTAISTIRLFARPFGQVFQLKHTSDIATTGTSRAKHEYTEPEIFAAKTDIEMRADTSVDTNGVSAGFDIVLVDD